MTRHGAKGDGRSDARAAFAKAIDECAKAGGGRVVVPAGDFFLAGPIHLKSGINLHLQEKAVVRFSTKPSHYLPPVLVRWEGTRAHNYSPLIYAYREKDIAITGRGTIDGQAGTDGSGWLELLKLEPVPAKSRDALREMGHKGVPVEKRVFGKGSNLRPQLFHAYECENILLHGVTFTGSPFWTLHPAFSRNITVRNVTVKRSHPNRIGNDDGFDPDSSQDVLVEGSYFDTVDDNIAIKSGRDNDAWERSRLGEHHRAQLHLRPRPMGRPGHRQRSGGRGPQRVRGEPLDGPGGARALREVQHRPGRIRGEHPRPQHPGRQGRPLHHARIHLQRREGPSPPDAVPEPPASIG